MDQTIIRTLCRNASAYPADQPIPSTVGLPGPFRLNAAAGARPVASVAVWRGPAACDAIGRVPARGFRGVLHSCESGMRNPRSRCPTPHLWAPRPRSGAMRTFFGL